MSEQSVFFSCIVTCYNREDVIKRSIKSILNQSYQNFEIIVIDDGSTDKSIERINAIKDCRIKLIVHPKNCGQNASINTGIAASVYSYLAFLDSDDEWTSNYLELMAKTYEENPNIDFAYSNFINGGQLTLEGNHKYAETLHQGFLSSMITITAKKEVVEFIGKFDTRYAICQDDDFCFRLAKNFSFKLINQHLAIIHGSNNSMSNNLLKVAEGWVFLFDNYKDDIILYCGHQTLSKHYINISRQFFRCKSIKKGMYFYLSSLKHFFKGQNNSQFKYPYSVFMKETVVIIKLNLGHIKRFLFKK